MALAFTISEKMTQMQKLDKNLQSVNYENRSRLSIDGGVKL